MDLIILICFLKKNNEKLNILSSIRLVFRIRLILFIQPEFSIAPYYLFFFLRHHSKEKKKRETYWGEGMVNGFYYLIEFGQVVSFPEAFLSFYHFFFIFLVVDVCYFALPSIFVVWRVCADLVVALGRNIF